MFSDIAPDLSSSISTNFSELDSTVGTPGNGDNHRLQTEGGYNFATRFEPYYKEHRETTVDRDAYYEKKRRVFIESREKSERLTSEGFEDDVFHADRCPGSGMSLCIFEVSDFKSCYVVLSGELLQ